MESTEAENNASDTSLEYAQQCLRWDRLVKARYARNMPTAEDVDNGQLQAQLDSGALLAIENGRVVQYGNVVDDEPQPSAEGQ